jgi:hypothetical protein
LEPGDLDPGVSCDGPGDRARPLGRSESPSPAANLQASAIARMNLWCGRRGDAAVN